MNEQLQAAKDEAAREYRYRNYDDVFTSFEIGEVPNRTFENFINRAMEIYAEMMVKEALTNAKEKRRTMFDDATELY